MCCVQALVIGLTMCPGILTQFVFTTGRNGPARLRSFGQSTELAIPVTTLRSEGTTATTSGWYTTTRYTTVRNDSNNKKCKKDGQMDTKSEPDIGFGTVLQALKGIISSCILNKHYMHIINRI